MVEEMAKHKYAAASYYDEVSTFYLNNGTLAMLRSSLLVIFVPQNFWWVRIIVDRQKTRHSINSHCILQICSRITRIFWIMSVYQFRDLYLLHIVDQPYWAIPWNLLLTCSLLWNIRCATEVMGTRQSVSQKFVFPNNGFIRNTVFLKCVVVKDDLVARARTLTFYLH